VGVKVAGIVGTSIGALIGAMIASGVGWRELVPLVFALRKQEIARVNRRAVLINGIRQEALFQGNPLKAYIVRTLPVTRWEELSMSFQINAVDLETGLTDWFGPGASSAVPIGDAVYASVALPAFYPPARIGSRVFVDGGA
jgi:NTE family protein